MSEELPRLTDPSEFEDLIVSLLPLLINDVAVGSCQRVAISGYKQFGIDIYCPQSMIAVQCKNTRNFSKKTLSADLEKTRCLDLPIHRFYFVTASDNTDFRHEITVVCQAETRFHCQVIYWREVVAVALMQPDVLQRFWPKIAGRFLQLAYSQAGSDAVRKSAYRSIVEIVSKEFLGKLGRQDFTAGLGPYQFSNVVETYQKLARAYLRRKYRENDGGYVKPVDGLTDEVLTELDAYYKVLEPLALCIRDAQNVGPLNGNHPIFALRNTYVSFAVHTWHNDDLDLMWQVEA